MGRKRCTSNRDDRNLENTVKQSWFKHLGELHKEWTEAGVSASRVSTLRCLQEKGYQATSEPETSQKHLTWATEKKNWTVAQWSKVLFSDKSKFCILFGNQGLESEGRLERHRIQAAWSPVWSFRSQWWFGVPWRLLVLVHCVLSSPKSMQPSTRRFWSTLCFHLLTAFMEMLISFSNRTLAPAHTAKTTSKWFCWPWYYCAWLASHLAWSEPHRFSKISNIRPNNTDELKAAIKATWASITLQQCHRLITSMPCRTEAVILAKGAPKYWVHN